MDRRNIGDRIKIIVGYCFFFPFENLFGIVAAVFFLLVGPFLFFWFLLGFSLVLSIFLHAVYLLLWTYPMYRILRRIRRRYLRRMELIKSVKDKSG